MTVKQIEARQTRESKKFESAKAIRDLLDKVKKDVGAEEYDGNDWENAILEMVTEEG